jgi:hypothetical protein
MQACAVTTAIARISAGRAEAVPRDLGQQKVKGSR